MSTHTPSAVPDTTPLRRLVRQTRRLLRSSWVITGLGLTVGLLVGTLVATTLLDLVLPLDALLPSWLAPTPWPGLRLAALLLVVVPAAWALFTGVVRPLFRRLSPIGVARRIEAHLPGIHNRLVSAIDLSAQPAQATSQAFYRRLLNEALERVRGFRPSAVIDRLSLRRAGLFALTSTGAFVLALVLFSDRMPTALARIFRPFADIPPATGVHYTVQASSMGAPVPVGADGLGHVLRGEDIVFDVEVTSAKQPDGLYVELTGPDGKSTLRRDLEKVDDTHWRTVLAGKLPAGLEDQFHYRVFGGRTWTPKHRMAMIDRPTLVGVHTVLHYPRYMDLPPEERRDPAQTAEVVGPEGTADDPAYVEVVAQAEGDVARGEVQLLKQVPRTAPVKESLENAWFDKELPRGARADGTWQWDPPGTPGRPHVHTEPPAVGLHGHWFSEASELKVRPGDRLFAYVYVVPGHVPETILLEWNDGTSWEHRAYWGAASKMLNAVGKADSPSRHAAGPLPPVGQWVRLEVPAASVGLEGKTVRGMAFKLIGGQCLWQKTGTLPEQKEWAVARRFEMQPAGDNLWSGRFPLRGTGHYRVELHNQLGYPNQAMKECKFTALPDAPPYVILERPGPDLVLSKPGKVGLIIRAQDDYGLKEIAIYLRRGDKGDWAREVVHSFDRPLRDSGEVTASLDLAARKLVLGDTLFYRVEAVDRRNQTAVVPPEGAYKIRLAAGPNAADERLAAFEKSQDPFQERLANLIAAQAKIKEAFDKLTQKYAPVMDKVQTARNEAKQRLDPASAKLLEAMKTKLTELAREQEKARQMGKEPSKPPAGAAPRLDAESAKLLEETRQKLTELAKERARAAQPQTAPSPAVPPLDAESRRLLAEARDKLSELTWQKEQNGRMVQGPKQSASPPLDAESKKVLRDLQNKLAQLDAEREKNALAGKGTPPDKPVQLDAETARQLAEMQKALAELAAKEQAVHQQGDQLSKDLARSAEEASKLDMLPAPIAEQMKHAQETFERQGISALRDLVESMQRAAAARKEAPPQGKDLEHIGKGNERAGEELEALKKRLEALAEARKKLGQDPDALADLDRKMSEADSAQAARDLKELKDYLSKLKDELAKQKDAQEALQGETDKSADKDLPIEEGKQDQMDRDVGDVLGKTKDLQQSDRIKRMKKKMRPDAPYTPEADDSPDRPREEDSDEPLPTKKGGKADAAKGDKKGDKKDDDDEDDEKKFLPQLGGRKDRIDPRYARKRRPGERKPGDPRAGLEDRQTQNLRDLDSAEKSVESDRRSLENMLNQMGKARQGRPGRPIGQQASDPLGQMMNSPQMRAAQSMLSRARQANGKAGQHAARGGLTPNLRGGRVGPQMSVDLDKLDLPTRAILLRMQPEAREKLLQSLRDAGPEGYEKHIMEYYKRLSEAKDK